ncbi:MAG TPA: DUF3094 family protein [Pseudomonadales bacterium]
MITERPELSDDDKKRVEQYLSSPIHQVERKPFRPIYFVFLTIGSVVSLLLLAMLVTRMAGIV